MPFLNKVGNLLKSAKLASHTLFGRYPTSHRGYQSNFIISKVKKNTGLYFTFFFLKSKRPFIFLWTLPFFSSKEVEGNAKAILPKNVDQRKEIQKAINKSDEMFSLNKFQEAASILLPFQDTGDVEVLWRLGRAQYKYSQQPGVGEPERQRLVVAAHDALAEAVARDDEHWAVHKWLGVLLDAKASYDGIKARVAQLERVKEHMLRAAELNPKDATTLYMIGSWCFHIADMSWVHRKIAATILAEPPKSSFEEALHYFTKAEEVQPRFYSQNLLMVGKTLLKLKRPEEAYVYLVQARDFPSSTEEDDKVRKEAAEILKGLNIKEEDRR